MNKESNSRDPSGLFSVNLDTTITLTTKHNNSNIPLKKNKLIQEKALMANNMINSSMTTQRYDNKQGEIPTKIPTIANHHNKSSNILAVNGANVLSNRNLQIDNPSTDLFMSNKSIDMPASTFTKHQFIKTEASPVAETLR